MSPKISLHIVAWNSMQFLPDLLLSIEKQTFQDIQVLVIDNGSSDGVQAFLQEKYPFVRTLRNARNLGFASAHNQGIRYALEHWGTEDLSDKFICVVNPEIVLHPTCLEELFSAAQKRALYGAFGGKLLRAYGDHVTDEVLKETIHSDRIESVGLLFHKNYTFTECGAGAMDEGQFDEPKDVFGFSGSLVMYRASALQSVRYQDEFFDADFFTYQEDVDLAFRLQTFGWQAWYVPKAIAYHYCGQFEQEHKTLLDRWKKRRCMSLNKRLLSMRNHWLFLWKNLDILSLLVSFPWMFISELGRFGFILFLEQQSFRAMFGAVRLITNMFTKRRFIMNTRTVSGYAIRKRFSL